MNTIQRNRIIYNLPTLILKTCIGDLFLSYFQSTSTLGHTDVEEIKAKETNSSKATHFYEILLTKGKDAFEVLLQALTETSQTGVLEILQQDPENEEITNESPSGQQEEEKRKLNRGNNSLELQPQSISKHTLIEMATAVTIGSVIVVWLFWGITANGDISNNRGKNTSTISGNTSFTKEESSHISSLLPLIEPSVRSSTEETMNSLLTVNTTVSAPQTSNAPLGKVLKVQESGFKVIKVNSTEDYNSKLGTNCNVPYEIRLILDVINPYQFNNFDFSCASQIHSLKITGKPTLKNLDLLLKKAKNIKKLQLVGSSICHQNRGKAYLIDNMIHTNLEKLETLSINDFNDLSSDCVEVAQFFAQNVYAPKLTNLNVENALINEKNEVEYEMFFKNWSQSLKNMHFVDLDLLAVIFGKDLYSLKLESFKFNLVNTSAHFGFDSIKRLLSIKKLNVDQFISNVEIPDESMRLFIVKSKKASIKQWDITIRLREDKKNLNLTIFRKIPKLERCNMTLVPPRLVKNLTVIGLKDLPSTLREFQINSEARFKVALEGLFCRGYSLNTIHGKTSLTLDSPICYN